MRTWSYRFVERGHSRSRTPQVVAGKASQLPEATCRRTHASNARSVHKILEPVARPLQSVDVEIGRVIDRPVDPGTRRTTLIKVHFFAQYNYSKSLYRSQCVRSNRFWPGSGPQCRVLPVNWRPRGLPPQEKSALPLTSVISISPDLGHPPYADSVGNIQIAGCHIIWIIHTLTSCF